MPETTAARFVAERAETRDEYWCIKRDGEVVALFFSKHEAEAYANWKNTPRVPSNGVYRN